MSRKVTKKIVPSVIFLVLFHRNDLQTNCAMCKKEQFSKHDVVYSHNVPNLTATENVFWRRFHSIHLIYEYQSFSTIKIIHYNTSINTKIV